MSCFRLRIDVQYLLVTLWLEVQKQPFADVLQNRCSLKFHNICKKTPVLQLFLTKLLTCRPVTYLKSNSSTGVFLCLFQSFKENLFWKTSASGCFWNLMKVFFDSWHRYYHSELVMKNVLQVHFIKRLQQHRCH